MTEFRNFDHKTMENSQFMNDTIMSTDSQPVREIQSSQVAQSDNFQGVGTMSVDASGVRKKERSNAKPVECLDMEGKLIEVYRSGLLASQALNIQQGDISLCCRGLKASIMGYKFRFHGAEEVRPDPSMKVKKGFGFVLESTTAVAEPKLDAVRSTRASRGEYGQQAVKIVSEKQPVLAPAEVKV